MGNLILLTVFVWAIVFMTNRRSKVAPSQSTTEPLTTSEKIQIWIICLLEPVIPGAIFYFGWRKRLPRKAKQANKISWIAVGIWLLLAALFFAFGWFGSFGYTELTFPSAGELAAQGKSSVVISGDQTGGKRITVYAPNDLGGSRLSVQDLETGKECTAPYHVAQLFLSLDETRLQLSTVGTTDQFVEIDTATCKRIDSWQ